MEEREYRTIERLIRNLSHAIKNPLTAIKGYAQLLDLKPNDNEALMRSQRMILEHVEKIDLLLRELYDIFSLRAERPERLDAASFLEESLGAIAREKNARLEKTDLAQGIEITADRPLLKKFVELIIGEFDWETCASVKADLRLASVGRGLLEIGFTPLDFRELDQEFFFLPFATRSYYRRGTELYTAYVIAHLHGWRFGLIRDADRSGFRLEF